MKINRRGFLGAILAAGVAPAIVRADALMRVIPRQTLVHALDDYAFELVCGGAPYLVRELSDVSPDGAKVHLLQQWDSYGSSRWIDRWVQLPEASTLGVDEAVKRAHQHLRAEALVLFDAFPDRFTIASHEVGGLHRQPARRGTPVLSRLIETNNQVAPT